MRDHPELAWRILAACYGIKTGFDVPDLWPLEPHRLAAAARPAVEAYCAHCPVILACRNWAERDESYEGVAAAAVYYFPSAKDTARTRRRIDVQPSTGRESYNSQRPLHRHLGIQRGHADCGASVNAGHTPEQHETAMGLPRCRLCWKGKP